MIKTTKNRQKGLSIVEALVYIAVFILAIVAVSDLLIYFYRSNGYVIQQGYAVESARKGIENMVREIREATYSDTGAYPVVDVQDQSFTFYSDVDKDKNIEKVRYFLDGTNFRRGEIEAAGNPPVYESANEAINIISDNVRNGEEKTFFYYNASSTEVVDLGQITDIKMIKINLVVNINPNRLPGDFTLSSSAQMRNLYEY